MDKLAKILERQGWVELEIDRKQKKISENLLFKIAHPINVFLNEMALAYGKTKSDIIRECLNLAFQNLDRNEVIELSSSLLFSRLDTVSIRVPIELKRELEKKASSINVGVSDLIRYSIAKKFLY